MPLYQKLLIGCAGLILLGFLMVGAMVLFGLAISQPAQRRIQSTPRTGPPFVEVPSDRLASSGEPAPYSDRRCNPPSTTS